jgi:hypothetical protein
MVPDRSKSKGRPPSDKSKRKRKIVRKVALPERIGFEIEKIFGTDEVIPSYGRFTLSAKGDLVAHFSVNTHFGTFAFVYGYLELPKHFTKLVKRTVNTLFGAYRRREIAALKAGRKLQNPSFQQVLNSYSEGAYLIFMQRLPSAMHEVPYRLLTEVLFALICDLEKTGRFVFVDKYTVRKMWDCLAHFNGTNLKRSWTDLRPGPSATTSKAERAEMLKYYNSILPECQGAKSIYKQNRKGSWRRQIRENHKYLDKDDIENIIRLKPSEVALLITGKRFRRIIGKDFHGEAELRRQLGIARKEAATKTKM